MTIKTIIGGIALTFFFVANTSAQKLSLSVVFPSDTLKASSLNLSNEMRDVLVSVPRKNKSSVFKASVSVPEKGLYQLEKVGYVYLTPKSNLEIAVGDGENFTFKGKQAPENELLVKLAALRKQLLPENSTLPGVPAYSLLHQSVGDFLATADNYKKAVAEVLKTSKDLDFNELAMGDADSYSRVMLSSFGKMHELDSAIYEQCQKFLQDPESKKDPNFYAKSLRARILPIYDGFLNEEDTEIVKRAYTDGFDPSNTKLLLNSPWYGRVVSLISFSDIQIDDRKLFESYRTRFDAIPAKFPDAEFAEEMRVQQGLEYLNYAKTIGGDIEEAYQKIGTFAMSESSKTRIEKAYLELKKRIHNNQLDSI